MASATPSKSRKSVPFADLQEKLPSFSLGMQRDINTLIGVRTRDKKKGVRPEDLEDLIGKESSPEDPDRVLVQELLAPKSKRKSAEVQLRPGKKIRVDEYLRAFEVQYTKSGENFATRAEFNALVKDDRAKLAEQAALTSEQLEAKKVIQAAKLIACRDDSQQEARDKLDALNQLANRLPKSGASPSSSDSDSDSDDEGSKEGSPVTSQA
jgi:hypothetical protein